MEKLVAWVEIPAVNFKRAVNFYSKVLDLNLETEDFGNEKMACFPSGEGAISCSPKFKPSQEGVLLSLNTGGKLDETIRRIEAEGGKLIQPKTKIRAAGLDYFALFIDCEGNKLGLYGN